MPIYEYRCPEGHTFELFQRMSDPPADACAVCGASPVHKVLYPVAVHFKGSGFYATDYGRAKRRDGAEGDGRSSETKSTDATSSTDSKPEKKAEKKADKKPAEA